MELLPDLGATHVWDTDATIAPSELEQAGNEFTVRAYSRRCSGTLARRTSCCAYGATTTRGIQCCCRCRPSMQGADESERRMDGGGSCSGDFKRIAAREIRRSSALQATQTKAGMKPAGSGPMCANAGSAIRSAKRSRAAICLEVVFRAGNGLAKQAGMMLDRSMTALAEPGKQFAPRLGGALLSHRPLGARRSSLSPGALMPFCRRGSRLLISLSSYQPRN